MPLAVSDVQPSSNYFHCAAFFIAHVRIRIPSDADSLGIAEGAGEGGEDSKPANEPRKGLATEAEAAVAASKVRIVYILSPSFHSILVTHNMTVTRIVPHLGPEKE